ncbi:RAD9, HUS1, RAD1-interacting nuclear orphan protein 1 isoform X2 [Notolabrus celidotus]|uniref:RAD9, HUS1, RAD1-interacting nuclear orphan protein 1 isoform X2 n=1 Tax=Notolabrus celidotus TaxID=1203425 RepID=UPI00149015BC|nr:RAD9, HUS1, RAD1-interacting nuclear orphan protein 1 isoform X2 [Notolabrus celidotus]
MPRKASRTDKPSLLFLERTLSGARLQNGPEVRAALNPREFFTETQAHSSSAHKSWTRQGDQTHHPKRTRKKKATESTTGSDVGNQPQGSLQISKTVSSVKCEETPKRQLTTIRKRNVERCSDAASSSNRCVEGPEIQSVQATERCVVPAHGASALALNDFSTTEVSSIGLPPDVDTPKVIQEGISCLSSQSLHLLLPQPCTPPGYQPPDILVADTPERDYGVKVTWRRRRGLMLLLKDRDHLSDSDVLVHS